MISSPRLRSADFASVLVESDPEKLQVPFGTNYVDCSMYVMTMTIAGYALTLTLSFSLSLEAAFSALSLQLWVGHHSQRSLSHSQLSAQTNLYKPKAKILQYSSCMTL